MRWRPIRVSLSLCQRTSWHRCTGATTGTITMRSRGCMRSFRNGAQEGRTRPCPPWSDCSARMATPWSSTTRSASTGTTRAPRRVSAASTCKFCYKVKIFLFMRVITLFLSSDPSLRTRQEVTPVSATNSRDVKRSLLSEKIIWQNISCKENQVL